MSDQLIREASSKYLPGLLGCLFLLSLILLPTSGMSYTDRIVAVVNKEVITWFDLQNAIQDEHSRLKAKYRGEELERRYTQKQREVLNALIIERLQLQEAKAKGITVTQEEIDATLRRTPLPPTQTEEEFGQEQLPKETLRPRGAPQRGRRRDRTATVLRSEPTNFSYTSANIA